MLYLLLRSILPEFDQYLVTYTFSSFKQEFQPQKNYAQVLTAQPNAGNPTYEEESKSNLNIFLLTEYVQIGLIIAILRLLFDSSSYIQYLAEIILLSIQNTLRIFKQITIHIHYQVSSREVPCLKFIYAPIQ
jgi:hypothetical protein